MEIINIIASAFIILLAILGLTRGFLEGITRFVGWIIALIIAIKLGPTVSEFLKNTFSISANVVNLVGAVIVFIAVIILLNISVSILKKTVRALRLGFADRILGFILGGTKAIIIIFILSFAVQWLPIGENNKKVITDTKVVRWSSETVAKVLATTNLDKQIKNNKYYKRLLKETEKIKKDIFELPTHNK